MTGWPAPFDMVQGILEGAWNGIFDSIDALWQGFVQTISNLWNSLVSAFDSLWRSILTGFDNLWEVFWVHSLPSWNDVVRGFSDVWNGFVDTIWNLWVNIVAAVDSLYHSVADWVTSVGNWIYARLLEVVGRWDPDKQRFVGGFLGWLWDSLAGIVSYVFDLFSGFGRWLTDSFDWLHSEVVGWLTGAMVAVGNAFSDAFKAIWDFLTGTLPTWFIGAGGWLNEHVLQPIIGGFQWVFDRITDAVHGLIDTIINLFGTSHPVTSEEAFRICILGAGAQVVFGGVIALTVDLASTKAVGTGAETRATGRFINSIFTDLGFAQSIIGTFRRAAVNIPLDYYFHKYCRPIIPDIPRAEDMYNRGKLTIDQYKDIVAMHGFRDEYVEGFVELLDTIPGPGELLSMAIKGTFTKQGIIAPPAPFAANMRKLGYSDEWAARFWTAHFTPIGMRDATDNFYRGLWKVDELKTVMLLNGIDPRWQDYILRVIYKPPGIRELTYGYDTQTFTADDIVRVLEWQGRSPDDAVKGANAIIARRTQTLRNSLQTEAVNDYIAGLDSEEGLRSKLGLTGARPEVIELVVTRAKYREDRDIRSDLITVVKDQYVKGYSTEEEFRKDLTDLGVVPTRIEVLVLQANDKKAKAVKAATAAKKKQLTEANLTKAWELGLVTDSQYTADLVERDYTPEDAQLLLEIARTPAPVSPEEITRRTASIQARINSTNRSYDLMFTQIDNQVALISDEIQGTQTTMNETLDVYDTELSFLAEEASTAEPDKLPKILQRMELLKARRDVVIARAADQLTRLQDNLASTADRKQQLIKNRDGIISDLNKELQAVLALKR